MTPQPQDNIIMKIGNTVAQWYTNSNAATPLIFFLIVAGIFALIAHAVWLLALCILGVGAPLVYAFLFADHKLRDSKHSLAWRKLDMLGHKGEENVIEGEVVQPVLQTRQQQISAKANITKKAES